MRIASENMYDRSFIDRILHKRKEYLNMLKKETEKKLKSVPQGTLRISSSRGHIRYYHRQNSSDRTGTYLPASKIKLVRQLAQKGYEEQVHEALSKEIQAITAYESLIPGIYADNLYENLSEKRRALVEPVIETDEVFIDQWKSVSFSGKSFPPDFPEFYTRQGERVRSKSEVIIADLLSREGIPYRYEFPVQLKNYGVVYPDFTVLNIRSRKEMYWEHLGMMDNPEYAEKVVRKISEYMKNGLFPGRDLIISYETSSFPMNTKDIQSMIDHYLR